MGQRSSTPSKPQTTVIIPTYNEAEHITRTISAVQSNSHTPVEVIVADGFSSDATVRLARRAGAQTIRVHGGRAAQMNAAVTKARTQRLLFLHADTLVSSAFDTEIAHILNKPGVIAGAFRLVIDSSNPALRVIERVANWRASLLKRPYGDQGLFFTRKAFADIGGFPQLPILEDYEIVRRVGKVGRLEISQIPIYTSARRWETLGVIQTSILNQMIIVGYHCGVSVERLRKWYRGGLLRANRRSSKTSKVCTNPNCP